MAGSELPNSGQTLVKTGSRHHTVRDIHKWNYLQKRMNSLLKNSTWRLRMVFWAFYVQPWPKPQRVFSAFFPPWLECLSCPYQLSWYWGTRALLPANTLARYSLSARTSEDTPQKRCRMIIWWKELYPPGTLGPSIPTFCHKNELPEQAAGSVCPPGLLHAQGGRGRSTPIAGFHKFPSGWGSSLRLVCGQTHTTAGNGGQRIQKGRRAICKLWGRHEDGLGRAMNWDFMRDTGRDFSSVWGRTL